MLSLHGVNHTALLQQSGQIGTFCCDTPVTLLYFTHSRSQTSSSTPVAFDFLICSGDVELYIQCTDSIGVYGIYIIIVGPNTTVSTYDARAKLAKT